MKRNYTITSINKDIKTLRTKNIKMYSIPLSTAITTIGVFAVEKEFHPIPKDVAFFLGMVTFLATDFFKDELSYYLDKNHEQIKKLKEMKKELLNYVDNREDSYEKDNVNLSYKEKKQYQYSLDYKKNSYKN